MRVVLFAAALAAAGCVGLDTSSTQQRDDVDGDGDDDGECECKIEGSAIGQVGYRVHAGDATVVFLDWIAKADSPGEYVGFLLSDDAEGVSYVVKTGGEQYAASGTAWMHPNGDEGSEVPGISNVDFCEDDDYPDGDPPDDQDPPPDEDIPDVD